MCVLLAGRSSHAQQITIETRDAQLPDVLQLISRQANIGFVYDLRTLRTTGRVSLKVENMALTDLLDTLLLERGLRYAFIGRRNCCIYKRELSGPVSVKGKVVDESGLPLPGAFVQVNNLPRKITDSAGVFSINNIFRGDTLSVSYVGFNASHLKYEGESNIVMKLSRVIEDLPPIVVYNVAYYGWSKDRDPGSYSNLSLNRMLSANVLESMYARIPGFLLTPANGLPGSTFRFQFRGQSSIGVLPGTWTYNDPLIIIDGFPYAANYYSMQPGSTIQIKGGPGRNAYVNLNVYDLENITVLKDEEALALYGSRGANGVILLNTKRGRYTHPGWHVKSSMGFGKVNAVPAMLNAQQYLAMRREAFKNDNTIPTELSAPDLVSMDTTRYIDYRKYLLTTISREHDLQAALSGGSPSTQYYVSGGYHQAKTPSPRNVSFNRRTLNSRITQKFAREKLQLDALNQLAFSERMTGIYDLAGYSYLPPVMPQTGNETYAVQSSSILSGTELTYRPSTALRFSLKLAYNRIADHDLLTLPVRWQGIFSACDPLQTDYSIKSLYQSRIVEPLVQYTANKNKNRYTVLLGATMQKIDNRVNNTVSVPMANDTVSTNSNASHTTEHRTYNYINWFSNFGVRLSNKYLMSVTLRREGSNLLRANDRFKNFGAISAGWVFSNDSTFKSSFPFISYGKLKGTYGISGNDQYVIDTYSGRLFPAVTLQGSAVTAPPWITARDYTWQVSRKMELGMELGLWNDRVFLDVSVYRNRTGNQITGYPEPAMGLRAIRVRNSPATVQNKGLEMALRLNNNSLGRLTWGAKFVLTVPKNKLLSFPGLSTSPYAYTLVTGQSLTVQQGYTFTGVNPQSGLFEVADLNKDGRIDREHDFKILGDLDPRLYGSADLDINYDNWRLIIFLEGRIQKGFSRLAQIYANLVPGASMANLPVEFLNRWRIPGDQSNIQRLSAANNVDTRSAINKFIESDARLTSASYLRLQYIDLSYDLPLHKRKHAYLKKLTFYLKAENLFTFTKYKEADPQIQNAFTIPLQRSLTAGVWITL
jgi:TonB-dependent SusC/RagA subfamily outer membrane receptor